MKHKVLNIKQAYTEYHDMIFRFQDQRLIIMAFCPDNQIVIFSGHFFKKEPQILDQLAGCLPVQSQGHQASSLVLLWKTTEKERQSSCERLTHDGM